MIVYSINARYRLSVLHYTELHCMQALALGARAVFLGRPVLWGLAHSGEEGVFNVLKLLNDELVLAMKLAGCVKLAVR